MTEHKKYNALLGRHEVALVLKSVGAPSKNVALEHVAKEYNADLENVVVKNVKNRYGSKSFVIDAFIYDNKGMKDKFEPKIKVKKTEGGN